jgi:two-component system chemotaxis response regulator CheY
MALNILVVDDSMVMRTVIIKTLKMCGIPLGEIYQASNGLEGIQVLEKEWIDLALVDINMPVMSGDEMIDKIRNDPTFADLPVIVISTESSETRIEMLIKKGAEFVHKPFSPENIRRAISRKIGGLDHGSDEGTDDFGDGPDF